MYKVTTSRKFSTDAPVVRTATTRDELAAHLDAYGVPVNERGEAGVYVYGGECMIEWVPIAPAPAPRRVTQLRAFGIRTGEAVNLDGRVVKVTARRIAPGRVEFLFSDGTRQTYAPGRMIEVIRY